MKKIISLFLIFCTIFTLSACGNNSETEVVVTAPPTSDEPYIYSQDVVSLQENNIEIVNPFPNDKLLDRYDTTLYYFSGKLGIYTTDLIGSTQNILKTFENNKYVVFSTNSRINMVSKNGQFFKNLLTREDDDKIEILFTTNDWIYYKTTSLQNNIRFFKINLSGTCKELKHDPSNDPSILGKIYGDYFFPELLDYTMTRGNRHRCRKNNFYITFPDNWKGNFSLHEENGIFIVYYRPRLDTNIQYEFFRVVREDIPIANNLTPIPKTNNYVILPSGKYIVGRYSSSFSFNDESFDGVLINRMIKDIPEIIYSIER